MVEHHQVVLTANAGLLVATERRVRRVGVVLVHPHTACLNSAASAVSGVSVARPDTGTETVDGVICDADGLVEVLEGRHRQHRAEDFLLEDLHRVVTLEHRWLNVEAAA